MMRARVWGTVVLTLVVTGGVAAMLACGESKDSGSNAGASGGASTSSASSSGGSSGGSSSGGASGSSTSSGGVPGPGTMHAGCKIFPDDNPWNLDVSGLPVDTALMSSVMPNMALGTKLHPDWGTATDNYGIPITVGKAAAPATITFHTNWGPAESDKLPCPGGAGDYCYPIPLDAKIEGGTGASNGSDRHILFLANDGAPNACVLYELYNAYNPANGGYSVGSAAIWKLDSNARRTEGWTSADAAGLPILPGLVRREEIAKGEITHAIRFTMGSTRQAYIYPATHAAGEDDPGLPPMGLRVRLKASFDESGITGPALVIVKAMKKYGLLLADNGSDWYISGETSNDWGPDMDDLLGHLGKVRGSDFEIVKTGDVIVATGN